MAASGIDAANLPPDQACRKCKMMPVSGLKCVKCGVVLHPGCVKYLKNVKILVENRFVICCEDPEADIVKSLNSHGLGESRDEIEVRDTITSDIVLEIKHLKLLCTEKEKLLNEKDMVISTQKELIASLKDQLRLYKFVNESQAPSIGQHQTKVQCKKQYDQGTTISEQKPATKIAAEPASNKNSIRKKNTKTTQSIQSTSRPPIDIQLKSDGKQQVFTNEMVSSAIHTTQATLKCNEIININNDDDDGFVPVKNIRKHRKNKPIIGSSSDTGLHCAPKLSFLHVYKLHPSTTTEQLTSYLKPSFPEVSCEKMNSRYPEYYSSFKIVVNELNSAKAEDPSLWPAGCCVNRYVHFKKRDD